MSDRHYNMVAKCFNQNKCEKAENMANLTHIKVGFDLDPHFLQQLLSRVLQLVSRSLNRVEEL